MKIIPAQTLRTTFPLLVLTSFAAVLTAPSSGLAAGPSPVDGPPPAWLGDLSLGVNESYDDNVLAVSGDSMRPQSSLVTDVALKLGVNLAPVPGGSSLLQTLSLVYQPDFVFYHGASSESYDAHRIITSLKGKSGPVTFSLENTFLYNDGSKVAPTYALNQLTGAGADQNDKFRNNYAHSLARERRNQLQDRGAAVLQYSGDRYFIRSVSSLTWFDLRTDLHNTAAAPYKGYQDYIGRYDANTGVDFGWRLAPALALTLGYRYGYQEQDRYAVTINSDQHDASGHYQRMLLGLEGKLGGSVTVKLAAGPEFRDFTAQAPVSNPRLTRYYAEAAVSAATAPSQSLNFNFKQWIFVASTGLVPYVDTTCTLTYHWSLAKKWGFDLGSKILEANYTMGNEDTGSAPSLRDDLDYGFTGGLTYAVSSRCTLTAGWNYDLGRNGLHNLPASLQPAYREFDHSVVQLGLRYKF